MFAATSQYCCLHCENSLFTFHFRHFYVLNFTTVGGNCLVPKPIFFTFRTRAQTRQIQSAGEYIRTLFKLAQS